MTNIITENFNLLPKDANNIALPIKIQNPPYSIHRIPLGSIISGTAEIHPTKNLYSLNTIFGKLYLKTNFRLPENIILEFQILRFKSEFRLSLVSINSKKVENYKTRDGQDTKVILDSSTKNSFRQISTHGSLQNDKIISLKMGEKINATVLRTDHIPKAGTKISAKIDSNVKPQNLDLSNNSEEGPVSNISNNNSTRQTTVKLRPESKNWMYYLKGLKLFSDELHNQTVFKMKRSLNRFKSILTEVSKSDENLVLTLQSTLKTGSRFAVKLIDNDFNVISKNQSLTKSHHLINGVVIATTPQKQPIVQSELGMLILDIRNPNLIGKNLQLEILSDILNGQAIGSPKTRLLNIFRGMEWQSLELAINEIKKYEPQILEEIRGPAFPKANTQLASNMLFFIKVLKTGDLENWLGKQLVSTLNHINPELLGRLEEDFIQLGRAANDPPANEWRTTVIPFFNSTGLEQFRMYTQNHSSNGEGHNFGDTTRFVVDITLSKLGRIQLDGFVKPKGRQVDLIIRSKDRMPSDIKRGIFSIYNEFIQTTKIKGQVSFQVSKNFFETSIPSIQEEAKQSRLV